MGLLMSYEYIICRGVGRVADEAGGYLFTETKDGVIPTSWSY